MICTSVRLRFVRANCAGVGVRGEKRPFRRLEHVREPRVVQVRDVDQNAARSISRTAARPKSVRPRSVTCRAELVFPIPRQRHGADAPDASSSRCATGRQQTRAVFHAQKGRGLPARPRALHIGNIAAGRHKICEFSHLAVEIRAGVIKKADGLLPAQLIGHEHGEKLRPVDVLRNTCERQRARGIVECVDDVRSWRTCSRSTCRSGGRGGHKGSMRGTSFSKKITLHYTLFPPVSQPAKFKEF